MQKSNISQKEDLNKTVNSTLSLFSFLFIITAVICWSIKIKMTATNAGSAVSIIVHQGFLSLKGFTNHPLSDRDGYNIYVCSNY